MADLEGLRRKVNALLELRNRHDAAIKAEEEALIKLLEVVDSDRATIPWLKRVRDALLPLANRRGHDTTREVLAVVESRIEELEQKARDQTPSAG